MNEHGVVQLIGLGAWLILAASAVASFRMGWRKGVQMALVWAGIFTAVALLFSMVGA
ncbi:hypothetical protein GRI40_02335 [Altererythrobacter aerius]|uniref:Uncharacterized protein n=1 Tax=Tsuneonella aeria TaxID=1837929 RepID=A0A6I4TCC2_9SPHN|nr:hypothetical protein [Tsuneonella aeria]MXO74058.1 hypothetical protein [Tsuneonella aeria]